MKTDRKSAVWYFIITFAFAWILEFAGIFSKNAYAAKAAVTLCMFAPLLAVLIIHRGLNTSKTKIGWKPELKKNWKWYLTAWLGTILLTACCAVFFFLLFPGQFDKNAGYFSNLIPAGKGPQGLKAGTFALLSILSACLYGPINVIFTIGEETGWRGYMVPMLTEKIGRRKALLAGGVIWGIWHWPLILFAGYEYGTGYPGAPYTGALAMLLFTTVLGILLSYLYEKSGSIWVPALCHGTINAIAGGGLYFMRAGTQNWLLGPTIAGVVAIIPAAVLAGMCFYKMAAAKPQPNKND